MDRETNAHAAAANPPGACKAGRVGLVWLVGALVFAQAHFHDAHNKM